MSKLKEQYVEAAAALVSEGGEVAKMVENMREVMARRGHLRFLPSVLKALQTQLIWRARMEAPRLIIAREADAKLHPDLAEKATITIDASIIGGYIYKEGQQRTDHSYKTKLLNWYKATIN